MNLFPPAKLEMLFGQSSQAIIVIIIDIMITKIDAL